jgi:hypothetical protein
MKNLMITSIYFGFLLLLSNCSYNEFEYDIEGQGPVPDGDYYVAPWGDDTNPGTFEEPWSTWQKAFETAKPGNVVYFRGGVYYL